MINSREAIAAIFGDIVFLQAKKWIVLVLCFLYNSKNLNCIGALSFYDSKRSIGEVLFLINFIGVIFEAGNETREKI